jgi:hypothetical protein
MITWERRGDNNNLYGERAGKAYRIDRYGYTGAWVLRSRFLSDSRWEVAGEYSTKDEAMNAAG